MEYDFLVGHRVQCSYFCIDIDYYINNVDDENIDFDDENLYLGYSMKITGYVQQVIIDNNNEEKIYIIEDDGTIEWVFPFHENIEDLEIKILDWDNSKKDIKKVSRFEIMDLEDD